MTLDICKRILIRRTDMSSYDTYEKYRVFDVSKRTKDSETIFRDIRFCRMYFFYLKLCLELEQKKIKVDDKLIKVNKRLFKDHSLDTVLDSSFDDYFKLNKQLFVEETVSILKQQDNFNTDDYVYIKIPKSKTNNVSVKEIRSLIRNKLNKKKDDLFSTRKTSYMRLHIEYNSLIMKFNNYSRREIRDFINERYEPYQFLILQKKNLSVSSDKIINHDQSMSRIIRRGLNRLINFSENRIFP